MRLQSHHKFALVASYRFGDDAILEVSRAEAEALLEQPLGGHFSRCFGPLAVLYRHDDTLRFRVGDTDYPLDQRSIQRTVHAQTARLILTTPAKSYVFEYAMPETFAFDFTANAEDEHFDFGLFVINISGDSQRAARMYPDESRT